MSGLMGGPSRGRNASLRRVAPTVRLYVGRFESNTHHRHRAVLRGVALISSGNMYLGAFGCGRLRDFRPWCELRTDLVDGVRDVDVICFARASDSAVNRSSSIEVVLN